MDEEIANTSNQRESRTRAISALYLPRVQPRERSGDTPTPCSTDTRGEFVGVENLLQKANEEELIPAGVLVVRIDRDDQAITPTGETVIEEDDFVTIHSRSGITDTTLEVFTGG